MGKRRRAPDDGEKHREASHRAGMKPYRRYTEHPHTPELRSSSVDHEERGEWTTPTRAKLRCLDQYASDKLSRNEMYQRLDIPPRTGRDILAADTSRRTGKARPGRQPKIDRDTVQKMIDHISGKYQERILEWQKLGNYLM